MKREWKPGDVARLECGGMLVMASPFGAGSCHASHARGLHWHRADGDWNAMHLHIGARPLVVIDPEDREQVERVIDAYVHVMNGDASGSDNRGAVLKMQAALRSLIAPPKPPKPPEPTDCWAVVEDRSDVQWVRTDLHRFNCWQSIEGPRSKWASYEDIDVVRVIREGVTA